MRAGDGPMTADDGGGLVVVAVVAKPHGIAGALRVRVESDNPGRFRPGQELLAAADGGYRTLIVEAFVAQGDWGILTLSGVSTREQAEALRGADLCVPAGDLARLPEGSYYTFQIIGMAVRSTAGTDLGTVAVVETLPAGDAYVVRDGVREFRVPARGDIIRRIDLAAGVMEIDDVEGLR